MRIAMILSVPFPPQEGIGFYVWNLSKQLMKLGHEVQIITRGGPYPTSFEEVGGIPVWRPPFLPVFPFHVHLHSLFVDTLLNKLRVDIDLVHLHTPLVKFPRLNKPVVVTVHTPMRADIREVEINSWLGLLIKLQAPVSYLLEQEIFQRSDQLFAVANSVALELGEYGISPESVAVMGNGADTDIFYPKTSSSNQGQPYTLTVGRLGPRKGLDDLIQAAEIVLSEKPNLKFLIAGRGPYEGKLRREIAKRNLCDRVLLLGHITDRNKMAELYRGATAYIHPAHYEGLPTVLIEAMACGCPVIATAVSGALDVLQDGINGLLTPPRNSAQLAKTLLRLLNDPDLGKQIAQAGHQTIEERYSWKVVGRNYQVLYEQTLSRIIHDH